MKRFFPYFKYLRPVQLQLFLAIVTGIVYGISTGLGIPALIKVIFPKLMESGDLTANTAIFFAFLAFFVTVLRSASNFFNSYLIAYCGQFLLEKIRMLVFQKIQTLPVAFFRKYSAGDLITRTMSDTSVLQHAMVEFSQDVVKQPLTLIGTFSYLIYMCFQQSNVSYLLILILAIPVCIIPIRIIGIKLRNKALQLMIQSGEMTNRFNENLAAVQEIRSFCMEESEQEKYQEACHRFFKRSLKTAKYNVMLSPIIEVIAALGVGWAFFYAFKQQITAEVFLSTIGALYLSYEPIKKIGRLNNELQKGLASLGRIETVLNEPITISDPENPAKVDTLKGNIEFNNVSFAYKTEPVLKNISINIEAGKTYALVGSSGAGKTTFANLIPRFYDVNEGSISIDGINIRDMKLKDLRTNIGVVGQNPVLFHDTIYNNILVGNPKASKEEVIDAAKKAYAHDFIMELPNGYETDAGQNGNSLSGGQKQRIAIARTFLKNAPMLILDEATSALDAVSERYIQLALEQLIKGKTVIIIAHRFSSIKHANNILVFDQGKIIEQGSHAELMAMRSKYFHLYKEQMPTEPVKDAGAATPEIALA